MYECFGQCQPATELEGCSPAAAVLFVKAKIYTTSNDRDICTYIKYANILDMIYLKLNFKAVTCYCRAFC